MSKLNPKSYSINPKPYPAVYHPKRLKSNIANKLKPFSAKNRKNKSKTNFKPNLNLHLNFKANLKILSKFSCYMCNKKV